MDSMVLEPASIETQGKNGNRDDQQGIINIVSDGVKRSVNGCRI
jgi:hypothetical protein